MQIYLSGYWRLNSNIPTDAVAAYDISAHRWVTPGSQRVRCRAHHGVAFFNGSIYCLGSFDQLEKFHIVHS